MNTKYYYIHNVCYWHGNDRPENLWKHADKVKSIDLTDKEYDKNLLVISLMCDEDEMMLIKSVNQIMEVQDDILDVVVFPQPNSGGTVKSMWNVYKHLLQKKSIVSEYFGTWEDDFVFAKPTYIDDIKHHFDEGCLFVGSMWHDEWFKASPEKFRKIGKKTFPLGRKPDRWVEYETPRNKETCQTQLHHNYWWCEDPYVMKYENLEKIESLIGKFTLAPDEERYRHGRHGIFFGEVGFPTRLHHAGGNFFGVDFDEAYEFLNATSDVAHKDYYGYC